MEDRPRQNKKRKREKHHKSQNKKENSSQVKVTHQPKQASSALPNPTKSKGSTFLDKMRARLSGGHFRMINEKLYTCRFFFFVNSLTITMLIYFWVILVSLIFVLCVCVVFILSGKDALDYFKEDPALFDVVSFVFFHSINEFTLRTMKLVWCLQRIKRMIKTKELQIMSKRYSLCA